jgi:sugar O-acyltransferase (sialic acid O-acetyltransferase NeuD family)
MTEKVLLVGGFIEIIELCEDNNVDIIGIVDPNIKDKYLTYPIIGNEKNIDDWKSGYYEINVVITPDLPSIRKKLAAFYKHNGFNFFTLVSGAAKVSKSSKIGIGSVIQGGSNISSETIIGDFVKVNNHANIMHNSCVGSFSTIAPNAVLLGNVKIGEACYIGANATVLPHITICDNVTIGAGAVVTRNISIPNVTYAGIPARQISK